MHLLFPQPLLAADFTQLAITLVVIFFAVMKQLYDASKKANKKQAGAPNLPDRPPQPPQAGPKPIQAGGQQADPLRDQVEEFLRRAQQRQPNPEPAPKPQPRPASEIEVLLEESRRMVESRNPSAPPKAAPLQPAEPAQRTPRRAKRRQSVAEHVAEQAASRSKSAAKMSSQLGKRIIDDDQQFDVELKARFDHALGGLAGSVNPVAEEQVAHVDSPAQQIAAMLANPVGVRQAMIVNEILSRPSDRW